MTNIERGATATWAWYVAESGPERATGLARKVNRAVVLALWLALTCAPSVAVGAFVSRTPLGTVCYVLGLVLAAPALSAGLYTARGWRRQPVVGSTRLFWRGYRTNVRDVLAWCVPSVIALAVITVDVGFASGVSGEGPLRAFGIAAGLILLLWAGNALVISSFFSFRMRDVARLAAAELFYSWRLTLANVCLLFLGAALVYALGDATILLAIWAFVLMLELCSRPLVSKITDHFTTPVGLGNPSDTDDCDA